MENKSNAILGFTVLQSILLAEKLSETNFKEKLTGMGYLFKYILCAHSLIIILAVIFIFLLNKKINTVAKSLTKDIFSKQSSVIKASLIVIFGIIPMKLLRVIHMNYKNNMMLR